MKATSLKILAVPALLVGFVLVPAAGAVASVSHVHPTEIGADQPTPKPTPKATPKATPKPSKSPAPAASSSSSSSS